MAQTAITVAQALLARTLNCDDVQAELSRQTDELAGPADLIHFLQHFVVDQDLRNQDPEYAKWQESELRRMTSSDRKR